MKAATLERLLWIVTLLGLALFMLLPPAAHAEVGAPPCMPFELAAKTLADKWAEEPLGMGMVNENAIVVFFASPNGTWTIVLRKVSGETCFVASGDNWVSQDPGPKGTEG